MVKRVSYNCYYAESEDENRNYKEITLPLLSNLVATVNLEARKRIEESIAQINFHYQHKTLISDRAKKIKEDREKLKEKLSELKEAETHLMLVDVAAIEAQLKVNTDVEIKEDVKTEEAKPAADAEAQTKTDIDSTGTVTEKNDQASKELVAATGTVNTEASANATSF